MTRRAGTWRLPALAVALAVAAGAQDPLAAFDREYAAASAADSREDLDESARREAYRAGVSPTAMFSRLSWNRTRTATRGTSKFPART